MAEETATAPEGEEVITTLFMSGLPYDVLPREVHNLFRFAPGYQHSKVNSSGKVPTAFINFADVESAEQAKQQYHGLALNEDEQPEMLTRIEWAKKNSKDNGKKSGGQSTRKRARLDGPFAPSPYDMPAPFYGGGGGGGGEQGGVTTLFVANIGTGASEANVRALFNQQQGMRTFKFNEKQGRGAVAFVDFTSHQQAMQAMHALQGNVLPSSTSGGLRIEFAKKSMGVGGGSRGGGQGQGMNGGYAMNAGFAAAAAAAASPYMAMQAPVAQSYYPY